MVMAKFKCDRCGYPTDIKSHYDAHIAANSCKEGKLNSRVKSAHNLNSNIANNNTDEPMNEANDSQKVFKCPICNQQFPRKFNRDRHYNDVHINKTTKKSTKIEQLKNGQDGHDNVMTNTTQCHNPNKSHNITDSHNIIDSQNTISAVTDSHNTINYNNCNFISSPPMHSYLHYDINDLTLFEQYLVFYCHTTQCDNIYKTLMNLLNFNPNKPEYHNIIYSNIKSSNMRVFDGNRWILQTAGTIEYIVETQRTLLHFIYNKFRIFIGRRSVIYAIKYLYDGLTISDKHKELIRQMKLHIYNKTKYNDTLTIDENVLFKSDHEIWDALSKSFTWKDVVFYIDKLESINVDFSHNLSKIRDHITDYLELHPKESPTYELIIHKINILANEYLYDKEDYSSSDSDEINNHIRRSEVSSSKYHIRVGKREVNPAKYAKKYEEQQKEMNKKDSKVKLDDHKTMAKKVNYYGSKKIGMPYLSETTSD